jgi:iron complex outermembrane recepter protein
MIKNSPPLKLSIAFILLLSFDNLTLAEQLADSEEYYLQEFPVVLSASRLAQPLEEAPNAMTVIDREMIKASGLRRIPDLFKLVPGMYVSYNSGNEPFVAYHGSTDNLARRMQVLVDGRSVFMPPIGSVFWENLPLQIDDIERIEVIRGPAAASHGSNSTQGVLNIITREAGAAPGFKASVTEGNGGISDASMSIGKRGETLDYRLSIGRRGDDGYDAYTNTSNNTLTENNDSYSTNLFNLRSNYHPNAIDSFDIQLGLSSGILETGQTVDFDPDARRNKENSENFQQLTWLRNLPSGDELKLQYYHIHQNELNSLPPRSVFGPLDLSYANTRDNLELQHTLQTSINNRLVWGASYRRDWVRAPTLFREEQTVLQTTLFAHDEWRITPQWLLNTGAMHENSGLGQQHISPRAALIYKLNNKQTLRTGISKAYRNPSVYEERGFFLLDDPFINLNYYPIGSYQASGGLRSERILSREIGYLGEFIEHGFSIDTRLYHDRLNDIIYETQNWPKDFVNILNTQHTGFEVTTKHYWGDRNTLTFNYAYQRLSSDTDLPYARPYSESMPRNMVSALYSKKFTGNLALSFAYYQQSTMHVFDQSNPINRQPPSRRWDMRIAKGFKQSNSSSEGEIALVVQGLFNEHYFDYLNTNKFNQRTYLVATFRY